MNKKVKHEGVLKLTADLTLPCYVLDDGTRVLSGRGMQNSLLIISPSESVKNEDQRPGGELGRFIGAKWFKSLIHNRFELEHFDPIICYKGNQKINGYEASTLIDLCNIILEARNQDLLKTERQFIVAAQCEFLVRSFAKVGLIALIDEATGYQYDRERDELQKILKAYIAEELLPWQKTFPDNYYIEIFRLNGWEYTVSNIRKRPGIVGTWTNKLIYEQLPKGVLDELKAKTPKSEAGNYTARFFQHLKVDTGQMQLQKQLNSVIPLMQVSDNWQQFLKLFNKLIDRRNGQLELKYEDLDPNQPTMQIT